MSRIVESLFRLLADRTALTSAECGFYVSVATGVLAITVGLLFA